jgi:uncharacterized integral membrane protein (TIGR00698 family)
MVANIQAKLADTASVIPGVLICVLIAMSATFLSDHHGGPRLLYALLMGLSLHFLTEQARIKPGIDFCARSLLRLGVALMGVRVTVSQVMELGVGTAVVAAIALGSTIVCGLLLARVLRVAPAHGVLSGGAVAICGASAAIAISSVLPATRENERFTLLTIVGVTLLSTLAMVLYPFLLGMLPLSPRAAGVVIGGTIHDVAQVVAAGMLIGPEAAETATVVKLFRVMLLMPVVLLIAVAFRKGTRAAKPASTVPLVPGFLIAFVVLMLLTSVGAVPSSTISVAGEASQMLLVIAIGASGIKTTFADLLGLGWRPVLMLASETVFIAVLVTISILMLGLT